MRKLLSLLIVLLFTINISAGNTNANVKRIMGNWTVAEINSRLINGQWGVALTDSVLVMKDYTGTLHTCSFSNTDTLPIIKLGAAFVECNSDGTITISPSDALSTTTISGVKIQDLGPSKVISEDWIVLSNTPDASESYISLAGTNSISDQWSTKNSNNTNSLISMGDEIVIKKNGVGGGGDVGQLRIEDGFLYLRSGVTNHSEVRLDYNGDITLSPNVGDYSVNHVKMGGVPMISPVVIDNTIFIAPSGDPNTGTVVSLQQSTINLAVDKSSANSNIDIEVGSITGSIQGADMLSLSYTGSASFNSPDGLNSVDVSNSGVSILPASGQKIHVTDNVIISPVTDDGTKSIILASGPNPATGPSLQLTPNNVTLSSVLGVDYFNVGNGASKIQVGTIARFQTNATGTDISSQNGTNFFKASDALCVNTNDEAEYDADATNSATVNKAILENRLITAPLRKIVKGYTEPYTIVSTFDNPTRTISITSTTDTVEFYSGGNLFRFPNGDPALSYQIPDLNQWIWTYQDSAGEFQSETTVSLNSIRNYNLGPFMRYDVALGVSIATIKRIEGSQANEVENEASYETKSIIANEAVLFTGSIGSNSIGHSGGTYYTSRDTRFDFLAVDSSAKTWVKYYQDTLDDVGKNWVRASQTGSGVPYFTDDELGIGATGRLVYDSLVNGYFKIAIAPLNDYVACHFMVADGATQNVLSIMGQEVYNSVQDARDGLAAERSGLVIDSDVFHDAGIVGSCIFKSNGELQYIDATLLTLFDYPVAGVASGISAGPGSQNLTQVLQTGNDAGGIGIDNMGTALNMKNGLEIRLNFSEVLTDPMLVRNFDEDVIFNLTDAGILTLPITTTSNITAAGAKAVATTEWVDTALTQVFQFAFTFGREGFVGTYGGGTAWIPYTHWTEDGATLSAGSGIIVALNSEITSSTFQFDSMADDATAYYRINGGTPVSLGTVTSASLHNTFFPLSISVSAGDEVEFGFNGASGSTYTGCTVTTSVRQQ